jgi:hypothetical protein
LAVHWCVLLGIGGAVVALLINGVLHELFKRLIGAPYLTRFERYGRDILDGMRWPQYVAGGLMAALAEEPLFRGLLLPAMDRPALGLLFAALIFGVCHWLQVRHFGFWLWAVWEGVLFGLLMVFSGSLLVPMIAHGIHDVAAYFVFGVLVGDSQSDEGAERRSDEGGRRRHDGMKARRHEGGGSDDGCTREGERGRVR